MPFPVRASACWLVACCLSVGTAFCARQYPLLPDVFVGSWLWHAVSLFLVAVAVSRFCLTSVVLSQRRSIAILVCGHVAAMASTYAFLTSRVHCMDISIAIDYRLPDDTGAFILLTPSLALAGLSLAPAAQRKYR